MRNYEQTGRLLMYITKEFIRETDLVREAKGTFIAKNSFTSLKDNLRVPGVIAASNGSDDNCGLQWLILEKVGDVPLKSVLQEAETIIRENANVAKQLQAKAVLQSIAQTVAVIRGKFLSLALTKSSPGEHIIWADGHIGNMMTKDYKFLEGWVDKKNPVPNAPIWIIDFGSWGVLPNGGCRGQRNLQRAISRVAATSVFHETYISNFRKTFELAYDQEVKRSPTLRSKIVEFFQNKLPSLLDLQDKVKARFLSHVAVGSGPIFKKLIQQLNAPSMDKYTLGYNKKLEVTDDHKAYFRQKIPDFDPEQDLKFINFVAKYFRVRKGDDPKLFIQSLFSYLAYDNPEKRRQFVETIEKNFEIVRTTVKNIMRLCEVKPAPDDIQKVVESLNPYMESDFDFGKIFIKVAELADIGTCAKNDIILFGRGAAIILGVVNRIYDLVQDDKILGKQVYEQIVVSAVAKKYPGMLVWLAMKNELKLKINQKVQSESFFKPNFLL